MAYNFTHDDLLNAAVSGADSLSLSSKAPDVKPGVKMTYQEYAQLKDSIPSGFMVYPAEGAVYLLNIQGLKRNGISVKQAVSMIDSGRDSKVLGYPEDRDGETVVVTKQGEVVDKPEAIASNAMSRNLAWGAEGKGVKRYASKVSKGMRRRI